MRCQLCDALDRTCLECTERIRRIAESMCRVDKVIADHRQHVADRERIQIKLSGYYLVFDGQSLDDAIDSHNGGYRTLSEAWCAAMNNSPTYPEPKGHKIYKISTVSEHKLHRITEASYGRKT